MTLRDVLQLLLQLLPAAQQTSAPVAASAAESGASAQHQTSPSQGAALEGIQQQAVVPSRNPNPPETSSTFESDASGSSGSSQTRQSTDTFTVVGRGGKPVGTRRGGLSSATGTSRGPPPRPPPPASQSSSHGGDAVSTNSSSGRSQPSAPMGPPPCPPPRPTGRATSVQEQSTSNRRHTTPSPIRKNSVQSPSEPRGRGDKRSLHETTPPDRETSRTRTRVEAPERVRTVNVSPMRTGAAEYFDKP